jgi:soluble lytic murein transglycosylase
MPILVRSVLCAVLAASCLVAFAPGAPMAAAVAEAAPAADAAPAVAAARDEFVAALRRVRLGLPDLPDSAALRAYVIYDYLRAARWQRDLALHPAPELDAAIDVFLQERGNEPVTRALRHDWLLSLAARARWDWFLPRAREVADPPLACARLAGLLATGATDGLTAPALARWVLPQRQPPACDAVFAWLRAQNLLTPALAETRTRAALAEGNARLGREFAADVPAARAAPLLQWAQLLDAPQPMLAALVRNPGVSVEPEALAAAFARLARGDSRAALALLPGLLVRPLLTPDLRARLQRTAALGLAYDHDAAALAAFAALPADVGDDQVQEWRVRAALWAGDYGQALAWIEQMPATLGALPRWRYWRARSLAATAGSEAAAPLFAELAALRDYYGYLAADQVRLDYRLNARASPDDAPAQAALEAEPPILRAHALFDCDLTDDAAVEWNAVAAKLDAAGKIQAAHVASRWSWYSQSIATLAQSGDFDDLRLRYPRPYAAAVAAASRLSSLPQPWILAVMRQESLFRRDALSHADARGVMQMLLPTAAAVAKRWHLPPPTAAQLFDPNIAIPLGAAHIRDLLDGCDGQLALALAAYNAGHAAVGRWQPQRPIDADVWIENIPFNETRAYVQHILEHVVAYEWLRDAAPARLASLLPRLSLAAAHHDSDSR